MIETMSEPGSKDTAERIYKHVSNRTTMPLLHGSHLSTGLQKPSLVMVGSIMTQTKHGLQAP